ncbi:quinone reductase [Teratosphaeria destructans]|uniref:Quinone reductase n=1 Tax=Teratosphaeria destructans TaxID=418781 RepID=A0A9W7VZL1_9PEZI|nr:quinone reductase [Teratosphaeria destructans]
MFTSLRPLLLLSTIFFASLVTWLCLMWTGNSYQLPVRVSHITADDLRTFGLHAINNTVVLVPVNMGMLHLAENLLCSLRQTTFDEKKLVFWALDDQAQVILDGKGYATYRDPSLFATSENENKHGDTDNYKRMMLERPKFFMDFLSTGFDLMMLDADTVYFQSPLDMLAQPNSTWPEADIVFSTDAREFYQEHPAFQDAWRRGDNVPPVCNGIFWMASNLHTINIWAEMLGIFNGGWTTSWYRQRTQFWDDQRGMDVLLNDGRAKVIGPYPAGISEDEVPVPHTQRYGKPMINVRLLDQTQVVNGQLLRNRSQQYQHYLAELRAMGRERIAAHFNWATVDETKEEGAQAQDLWYLDDQGRCQSLAESRPLQKGFAFPLEWLVRYGRSKAGKKDQASDARCYTHRLISEVGEAPYPTPGPKDIIVKTAAVAINPLDYKIQDSNPPVAGKPIQYPTILGADLAGTIVGIGSEVKNRVIGQCVVANADGISRGQSAGSAFQMFVVVAEAASTLLPDGLAFEAGAVLPLGCDTAMAGLFVRGQLGLSTARLGGHDAETPEPGSAVLIWGGSSSVGCCAIQLANAAGYEVYTTASRRNEALCMSVGAVRVFDHSSPSGEKGLVEALRGKKVVGALDCIADGEKTIEACARILALVGGVKKVVAVLAPPCVEPVEGVTAQRLSIPALKSSRAYEVVHAWMARALADGSLQCKPDPYVVGEGLESVQAGVDMVRDGVSATKVVVRLSPC